MSHFAGRLYYIQLGVVTAPSTLHTSEIRLLADLNAHLYYRLLTEDSVRWLLTLRSSQQHRSVCAGVRGNCPLLLSDGNGNSMRSKIVMKVLNGIFHENPFCGSRVVSYRETDRPTTRRWHAQFSAFHWRRVEEWLNVTTEDICVTGNDIPQTENAVQ